MEVARSSLPADILIEIGKYYLYGSSVGRLGLVSRDLSTIFNEAFYKWKVQSEGIVDVCADYAPAKVQYMRASCMSNAWKRGEPSNAVVHLLGNHQPLPGSSSVIHYQPTSTQSGHLISACVSNIEAYSSYDSRTVRMNVVWDVRTHRALEFHEHQDQSALLLFGSRYCILVPLASSGGYIWANFSVYKQDAIRNYFKTTFKDKDSCQTFSFIRGDHVGDYEIDQGGLRMVPNQTTDSTKLVLSIPAVYWMSDANDRIVVMDLAKGEQPTWYTLKDTPRSAHYELAGDLLFAHTRTAKSRSILIFDLSKEDFSEPVIRLEAHGTNAKIAATKSHLVVVSTKEGSRLMIVQVYSIQPGSIGAFVCSFTVTGESIETTNSPMAATGDFFILALGTDKFQAFNWREKAHVGSLTLKKGSFVNLAGNVSFVDSSRLLASYSSYGLALWEFGHLFSTTTPQVGIIEPVASGSGNNPRKVPVSFARLNVGGVWQRILPDKTGAHISRYPTASKIAHDKNELARIWLYYHDHPSDYGANPFEHVLRSLKLVDTGIRPAWFQAAHLTTTAAPPPSQIPNPVAKRRPRINVGVPSLQESALSFTGTVVLVKEERENPEAPWRPSDLSQGDFDALIESLNAAKLTTKTTAPKWELYT